MKNSGFTITELVVVLVVIGILAAVLIPSMSGMSVFRQRGEYDAVVSAIQFARKSAIAKRRYVCVSLSATAVSLTVDSNPPEATATPFGGACPFATPLPLPTPDSACAATNQSCLQATSISSPPPAFQFDALGRAAATVTVTVTGFPAITVEAETGHVR